MHTRYAKLVDMISYKQIIVLLKNSTDEKFWPLYDSADKAITL